MQLCLAGVQDMYLKKPLLTQHNFTASMSMYWMHEITSPGAQTVILSFDTHQLQTHPLKFPGRSQQFFFQQLCRNTLSPNFQI